jgi:hypothetical protein
LIIRAFTGCFLPIIISTKWQCDRLTGKHKTIMMVQMHSISWMLHSSEEMKKNGKSF